MRRALARWARVVLRVVLVTGAAVVGIGINVVLLGYASAGGADPVGRFRPQVEPAASTTQVVARIDRRAARNHVRASLAHPRRVPTTTAPSPTRSSVAADDWSTESPPEPGESSQTETEPNKGADD
jgi:hypothetical protein